VGAVIFVAGVWTSGIARNSFKGNPIYYEYFDNHQPDQPLVVFIPGFTQYNTTPEFQHLKQLCLRRGWSYLIGL
jgi:hypothetical protein